MSRSKKRRPASEIIQDIMLTKWKCTKKDARGRMYSEYFGRWISIDEVQDLADEEDMRRLTDEAIECDPANEN